MMYCTAFYNNVVSATTGSGVGGGLSLYSCATYTLEYVTKDVAIILRCYGIVVM